MPKKREAPIPEHLLPSLPEAVKEGDQRWWVVDRQAAEAWGRKMYLRGHMPSTIQRIAGIPQWRMGLLVYGTYDKNSIHFQKGWKVQKEKMENRAIRRMDAQLSERLYKVQEKLVLTLETSLNRLLVENPNFSLKEIKVLSEIGNNVQQMREFELDTSNPLEKKQRQTRQELDAKLKMLNNFSSHAVEIEDGEIVEHER